MQREDIKRLFAPRVPLTPGQSEQCRNIARAASEFALVVFDNCPRNPDRTAAIRRVRDTVSLAYDAITLDGRDLT